MSVEFWAEFFQAAGLEPAVAASYANIFFVNKIQLNHLPDIDRDALREMNITPMGDILTILKYIKFSCPLVTSTATTSGNEQMLLHQENALKCNVQFRNSQDSKSGFCGRNQFECGAQHSVTQAENPFLSHYLHSADIQDGNNIPPNTVLQSPLNLTVHGKFSTNKKNNEQCNSRGLEMTDYKTRLDFLCNSVNSTVSCDTSEPCHIYSISPDKLEMTRGADGLKNTLEKNTNVSYVDSCEQKRAVKEKIIIPGGGTPHQKRSVFDRLGQRPDIEKIWVKTSFKQFSHNRQFKLFTQKCTPQRDNGVMRSNHLRKKWHCSPIDDDQVNNNMGSVNTITMEPEAVPASQAKPYNEDTKKETVSASCSNIHEMMSESSPGNSNKQLEVVCNDNLNDAGTSNTDKHSYQENSFHESPSAEDISQCVTPRIHLSAQQDEETTRSTSETVKLSQESQCVTPRIHLSAQQDEETTRSTSETVKLSQDTVTIGDPDDIFITHASPCFSSSPQKGDPELESLRDPTFTRHAEQFYLAWADRRKQAQSFPGFKPSFLQES